MPPAVTRGWSKSDLDPRPLLEEPAAMQAWAAEKKGIAVALETPDGLP